MSEELYSMLISKSNGMDTGLKPNLCLKAAKYESITPETLLATVEINPVKEIFQRCCSHINKKRDIHETLQNLENKPCLRPYWKGKTNLLHPSRQLQIMDYLPPPKCF